MLRSIPSALGALICCAALWGCAQQPQPNASQDLFVDTVRGDLPDGARWVVEMPSEWSGTVLLYSRGYSPRADEPDSAPPIAREPLLQQGYALVASSYPQLGWAVAEAIPSQLLALSAFEERFGKPQRVIAWGSSMGGLITSAIAERHTQSINGALAMCASSAGAVPMMNMAFDGAFALTTLIPPEPTVAIVGQGDDFDGTRRAVAAMERAREQLAGRARVALAGILGGLPPWSAAASEPGSADPWLLEAEMAKAVERGLFLPRGDQERRAGGVFSWNNGVDYRRLLEHSGRRAWLEGLYREAGLDLEADLDTLARAPRQSADPSAVNYMMDSFTPSGDIGVPLVSMHTLGDGMTSPSLQKAYLQRVQAAGDGELIRGLWIARAGHCTQSVDEMLAALHWLEQRIEQGEWSEAPTVSTGADTRFVNREPAPMPRSQ